MWSACAPPPAAVTGDGRWGFFPPVDGEGGHHQAPGLTLRTLLWQIHPFFIQASRKIMILRLLCYHPATMSHSQLPPAISTCMTNIIYINLPSCYHPPAAKSANPLRPSRLQTSSLLQRAARASIWVLCVPVRAGRLCTLPPILCAWPVRCLMRSPSAVPPLLPPLTRPSRRRPVRLRLPRAGAFGRPLGGSPYRKTRT